MARLKTTTTGRILSVVNKQRSTSDKEYAAYPTAALESILLTNTIDPEEGRDVAIIYVPNAFIQTRIEYEE